MTEALEADFWFWVLQLVADVTFGGRHSRTDPSVVREGLLSQAQQGSVV